MKDTKQKAFWRFFKRSNLMNQHTNVIKLL